MTLSDFFRCDSVFFWFGFGAGGFFGLYGFFMVLAGQVTQVPSPWRDSSPVPVKIFGLLTLIFQFWFNFVGGFVGWVAVALLWSVPYDKYGWRELLTAIVAFVGITGYLPQHSTGLKDALAGVAKKVGG